MAVSSDAHVHEHSDNTSVVLGIIIAAIVLLMLYFFMIAPAMRSGQTVPPGNQGGGAQQNNPQVVPQVPEDIDVNVNVPSLPAQQ